MGPQIEVLKPETSAAIKFWHCGSEESVYDPADDMAAVPNVFLPTGAYFQTHQLVPGACMMCGGGAADGKTLIGICGRLHGLCDDKVCTASYETMAVQQEGDVACPPCFLRSVKTRIAAMRCESDSEDEEVESESEGDADGSSDSDW